MLYLLSWVDPCRYYCRIISTTMCFVRVSLDYLGRPFRSPFSCSTALQSVWLGHSKREFYNLGELVGCLVLYRSIAIQYVEAAFAALTSWSGSGYRFLLAVAKEWRETRELLDNLPSPGKAPFHRVFLSISKNLLKLKFFNYHYYTTSLLPSRVATLRI
jgi:hypothetical protein